MRIFLCSMGCVQIVTSVLILDDKVTSRVSDGANPDCVGYSTIITESNSCVHQDEHSHTISPQQEDNGRSGGSGDSTDGNEGSNRVRSIIALACALMKYISNFDKITAIMKLINSHGPNNKYYIS